MRALPVVLALLALPASAQVPVPVSEPVLPTTLALTIADAPGPIAPLGPFVALRVDVRYTFQDPQPPGQEATEVAFQVAGAPAWAVVTLSPSAVRMPLGEGAPCGCAKTVNQTAWLLVSTTQDAPAFAPGEVRVHADAAANGLLQASDADAGVNVTADYVARIDATTPTTVLRLGGATDVPITVTSFGNAATRVTFELRGAPQGLDVQLPPPLLLASRQQGAQQNSGVAQLRIVPGPGFAGGTAEVGVRAADAGGRGNATDATRIELELAPAGARIDSAGTAHATPGPAPLLALAAALLLARRATLK